MWTVRALVLVCLAMLGLATGRRGDPLEQAAAYGLACTATLLISPLAWGHYYMIELPAIVCLPIWLRRHGWRHIGEVDGIVPRSGGLGALRAVASDGRLRSAGPGHRTLVPGRLCLDGPHDRQANRSAGRAGIGAGAGPDHLCEPTCVMISPLEDLTRSAFGDAFGGRPTTLATAPGRVELLGNHTDYNGGLVLAVAINRSTVVVGRPRTDRQVRVRSVNLDQDDTFPIDAIEPGPAGEWARYVRGVVWAIQERFGPLPVGV